MSIIDLRKVIKLSNFQKVLLFFFMVIGFLSCEIEEPIPTFNLITRISPDEGGKIIISPESTSYQEGSVVTLTPQSNDNWVFKQ